MLIKYASSELTARALLLLNCLLDPVFGAAVIIRVYDEINPAAFQLS